MTPQELVVQEAALIDAQRWDEWFALYAPECRYWVPLGGAAQAEDAPFNALADEDRLLLTLRIERLKSPRRAHSQTPRSRCQHVLQPPQILSQTPQHCELRTPFLYIESRGERQVTLAGTTTHRLVRVGDEWRIRLKRIDLMDAGQALPAIQLFP